MNKYTPDIIRTIEPHLGGHSYKTHTDAGVLNYFKNLDCKSLIDIGCGIGGQCELALGLGWELVLGIDGDYTWKYNIPHKIIDFTKEKFINEANIVYDLAWSVEFLEHVESKYIPNFMPAFKSAKYIVVTFAPIGKPGHHHVNCNTEEYWINIFKHYDIEYNHKITCDIRNETSMEREFMRETGLAFINNSVLENKINILT